MWSPDVMNVVVPLASETLKPCHLQHPKISNAEKSQRVSSNEDESLKTKGFTFYLILDMGANREINKEYLIYDTLSLIGTVGGTLGLFIGFSFYDFFVVVIGA